MRHTIHHTKLMIGFRILLYNSRLNHWKTIDWNPGKKDWANWNVYKYKNTTIRPKLNQHHIQFPMPRNEDWCDDKK
jgi:hypothetical protein